VGGELAYGRTHDLLVCCACALQRVGGETWPADWSVKEKPSRNNRDKHLRVMYQAMIDHLMIHREAGHQVPQYAIDRLIAERAGR
jgi:hypothetical protein